MSKIRLNKVPYIAMTMLGRFIVNERRNVSEFTFNQPLFTEDGIQTVYGITHPRTHEDDFMKEERGTPLIDRYPQIKKYVMSVIADASELSDFSLVDYSHELYPITRYDAIRLKQDDYAKDNTQKRVYFMTVMTAENIVRKGN